MINDRLETIVVTRERDLKKYALYPFFVYLAHTIMFA